MRKQKGYNSIFFLTTLSVYLGLLLVGASPSVLAQPAVLSSGKVKVQNEPETEDDADKKSEDENIEYYFLVRLENALSEFVRDLHKLKQNGRYHFRGQEEVVVGCLHTFCSDNIVDATSSYINSWVAAELESLRKNLDLGADREAEQVPAFVERLRDERGEGSCKDFGLKFLLDQTAFELEISFSQDSSGKALSTADNLNALFAGRRATVASKPATQNFYHTTRARSENNQVLVVTRLPRGSLDALVRGERR